MRSSKRDGGCTAASVRPLRTEFQNVEPDIPVDHVDQSARVQHYVVALRRAVSSRRLRNEERHLLRRVRLSDIDDAQSAREPRAVDEGIVHMLLKLMGAEAARLAAVR